MVGARCPTIARNGDVRQTPLRGRLVIVRQQWEGLLLNFITETVVRLQVALSEARSREEGQTLVEYALILTMVSIGSIIALLALSGKINTIFGQISTAL